MSPQEIIIRPIISEKSADLEGRHNQYVFEVARGANKIEIGKAISMVFGVRVEDVRTMVVRADSARVGRFRGRRRSWKKAIITVHATDSIALFGES